MPNFRPICSQFKQYCYRTVFLQVEGHNKMVRDEITFNKYEMPGIEYRGIEFLFLTK